MSSSSSTAKENMQMSHQAVVQPALDLREPEPPAMTFERVLNTEEAAGLLQIHPKTLQRFAREGAIHGIHIGKLWRFRASEIEDWIQRQTAS